MLRKSAFQIGQCYSRQEIAAKLGGSDITYLPRVGEKIVCGCFNRQCNPDAPDVVLSGTGPERQYTAELLSNQTDPVPIFVKQRPGAWEYVGNYLVSDSTTDRDSIRKHHRNSITPLQKVTRVMFLEQSKIT